METARVDIRKLQLLNDRIGQCLDALAQVRLSVHGLQHSQATNTNQGFNPMQGAGQSQPGAFPGAQGAQDPRFAQSGQLPFAQQQMSPFIPPFAYYGGLGHTFLGQPFQQQPFQQPFQQQGGWPQTQGPWGNQQTLPFAQQQPSPIPGIGISGLSHTGNDLESAYARPLWADPMLQARVRETFPYLGYTLPPVVSLF